MPDLSPLTTAEQRSALSAGVSAVEQIETMVRRLEYLKTVQLATLTRLASRIAREERHADHGELVHRAVEAEVAAAIRVGQAAVTGRMGHADRLLDQYPLVSAAFSEGRISLRHTEVLVEAGLILHTPAARSAYEAEVLPRALETTPSGLRAHARRLAEFFAERGIDERHREARKLRGVRVVPADDGMADLVARIGAAEALAIKDRLSRIAHHLKTGEERGAQQLQADVFVDILLSGSPGGEATSAEAPLAQIRGRVQVSVPVFTLMGRQGEPGTDWQGVSGTDPRYGAGTALPGGPGTAALYDPEVEPYVLPAELEGYGPIDSETARRLAAGAAGWDRVLTHPMHGTVLAVDRYRPSAELRRALGARDQHCRFPGCARRLDHCDIDHTLAACDDGETSLENLAHVCRRHHTLKHFEFMGGAGWKPRQRAGGVLEWSSPAGRIYPTRPSGTVRFAPVGGRRALERQGLRHLEEPGLRDLETRAPGPRAPAATAHASEPP